MIWVTGADLHERPAALERLPAGGALPGAPASAARRARRVHGRRLHRLPGRARRAAGRRRERRARAQRARRPRCRPAPRRRRARRAARATRCRCGWRPSPRSARFAAGALDGAGRRPAGRAHAARGARSPPRRRRRCSRCSGRRDRLPRAAARSLAAALAGAARRSALALVAAGLPAAAAGAARTGTSWPTGSTAGWRAPDASTGPTTGPDPWVRLTILLGAPLAARAGRGARVLARRARRRAVLRFAGLVVLLRALRHARDRARPRRAAAARPGAARAHRRLAVAAAAAAARGARRRGAGGCRWASLPLPVAAALDGERALVGLPRVGLVRRRRTVTFDWNHSLRAARLAARRARRC